MKVKVSLKHLHMAPRKVRLVANAIRGVDVTRAQALLMHLPRRATQPLSRLLTSAVAAAEKNFHLKRDNLFVHEIRSDGGPTLKRWMPRAFGRAAQIRKRTSHVTLVLDERVPTQKAAPSVIREVATAPQILEARPTQPFEKSPKVSEEKHVPEAGHAPEAEDTYRKAARAEPKAVQGKSTKGFLRKVFSRKAI